MNKKLVVGLKENPPQLFYIDLNGLTDETMASFHGYTTLFLYPLTRKRKHPCSTKTCNKYFTHLTTFIKILICKQSCVQRLQRYRGGVH